MEISLGGTTLIALSARALWWPERRVLAVSDLHLGKAERVARRSGSLLPPYEVSETLDRLEGLVHALDPMNVICLGDSFDDLDAARAVEAQVAERLVPLMAGRRWRWIEGNHDPGPVDLPGEHLAEVSMGPLCFRHIALPGAQGEISGHYHPKAHVPHGGRRPCFLVDGERVILPAFGTYTGGLRAEDPVLAGCMGPGARALLTGPRMMAVPLSRTVHA